ncbi:MAG: hypothetical protein IJC76_08255 [Lachnospiraceae bacterium]|nr:hypothetical protein [Lachnospiraceae bacterium]
MSKHIITIIISSFFIAFSGLFLIVMIPNIIKLYAEGDEYSEGDDMVSRIERCDGEYYEKNYGELYNWLVLDDCKEEEFDIYWEMVNGYFDYCQYRQWSNCDEDKLPGSIEKAQYYREKVIDNANNVKFSMNQRRLEEFAEELE